MSLVDRDTWHEIFATMGRNRLRTFMTAFGVFWGILTLIILLAFGQAVESGISDTIRGFGSKQIYIWGGRTSLPYHGMRPGRHTRYDVTDIPAIQAVEGIDLVAPRVSLGGYRGSNNVTRGSKTGPFKVLGDYPAWGMIQPFEFYEGRFVNAIDIEESRKVAVIGEQVYDMLFEKGESAIGKTILIQGVYFEVVGRVHSTRSGGSADEDAATVYIPFTTFQRAFNMGNRVAWFALTAQEGYSPQEVDDNTRAMLKSRKQIHPEDSQAIRGHNAAEKAGKIAALFGGIRVFMWFVGLATLFAGMLGVSNIMIIVVRERTKEIGIRRALGAPPWAIVAQVMQESITLTVLAGYTGLVTAVALSEFLGEWLEGTDVPIGRPEVDFSTAIAATVIIIIAGAIAGFIPARHAVAIHPVEALRA
ncbi:MAG: ABC transporter permease [Myxococcales bacterium]|nr:ABC transporter permease [Myxococcales bacterium]